MTSPHVDAVHIARHGARLKFSEIESQLPKIRGNPRAPDIKGTLSDLFNETSQLGKSTQHKTSVTTSRYENTNNSAKHSKSIMSNKTFVVPSYFFLPEDNLFNSKK